ncbi:hypothetical protein ACFX19_023303 [Malus domestica]
MNPKKCAFGVRAGNFLGFLVHQRGVEVDKNKSRAIMKSLPPTNKDKENFEWGPPHQKAFDSIKAYLTSPPMLVPPQRGKPLKLYISASEKSIGSLLAQNNEGGNEQTVYYLSRILTEVETRYFPIAKLCLALYFTARRIGKWILALSEFIFQYVPQRAVKSQAIVDFLAERQESQDEIVNITGILKKASGARIVIINPQGVHHYYSFLLDYQGNTNNQAEYEALIIGLEILIELGAMEVEVFGDSKLVVNLLNGEYKCRHITMAGYYLAAMQLLSYWDFEVSVNHVPRESNLAANEMAQIASGVPIQEMRYGVDVEIQRRNLPSILERGFSLDVMVLETETEDWRSPIIHHLKDPSSPISKKNRQQATKYVL